LAKKRAARLANQQSKKTIWPIAMVIMALLRIVAPESLSMPIIGVKQ